MFFIAVIAIMCIVAAAVPFTPQGNIELKGVYGINNATFLNMTGPINTANNNITIVQCITFNSGGKICSA